MAIFEGQVLSSNLVTTTIKSWTHARVLFRAGFGVSGCGSGPLPAYRRGEGMTNRFMTLLTCMKCDISSKLNLRHDPWTVPLVAVEMLGYHTAIEQC